MGQKMPVVQININNASKQPQWYVVVTKFNYEQKFANDLKLGLNKSGVKDYIKEVVVPISEHIIVKTDKNGKTKKTIKKEKVYPSYVFVKAIMNELVWNYLRGTTGCATILATGSELVIMEQKDINKIKELCGLLEKEKLFDKQEKINKFRGRVGDSVEIINGVFEGYIGEIKHIDNNKTKVTIILSSNAMNIEVNMGDVELI